MNVLFLDIDGVLNGYRSLIGLGAYPHAVKEDQRERFDWVAVGMIRRVCEECDVSIVLSSSWRIGMDNTHEIANFLDLPIIDKTPYHNDRNSCRGYEIADWLMCNLHERYAIIDDDSDMLPDQKPYFVQTEHKNGMQVEHYLKLRRIFGNPDKSLEKSCNLTFLEGE
ncbi:HAD domain-containing protein [Herbaspirillum huttiense]|uniref:HAD domain-containing protein n=1 Tax=Herbaspirillum huttiense TaxID=863372 RepID=UPI0031DD75B5